MIRFGIMNQLMLQERIDLGQVSFIPVTEENTKSVWMEVFSLEDEPKTLLKYCIANMNNVEKQKWYVLVAFQGSNKFELEVVDDAIACISFAYSLMYHIRTDERSKDTFKSCCIGARLQNDAFKLMYFEVEKHDEIPWYEYNDKWWRGLLIGPEIKILRNDMELGFVLLQTKDIFCWKNIKEIYDAKDKKLDAIKLFYLTQNRSTPEIFDIVTYIAFLESWLNIGHEQKKQERTIRELQKRLEYLKESEWKIFESFVCICYKSRNEYIHDGRVAETTHLGFRDIDVLFAICAEIVIREYGGATKSLEYIAYDFIEPLNISVKRMAQNHTNNRDNNYGRLELDTLVKFQNSFILDDQYKRSYRTAQLPTVNEYLNAITNTIYKYKMFRSEFVDIRTANTKYAKHKMIYHMRQQCIEMAELYSKSTDVEEAIGGQLLYHLVKQYDCKVSESERVYYKLLVN